MTEIFSELAVIGVAIDEEDKVVQVLASLPDSYNTLVTALEANEKVPSMEVVTERLLYEERRASDRSSSEQRGAALTSKQRGSRRGPKCYSCQKYGHIQRNCTEKPQSGSRPHYESSIKSNRPFREYKKKRKYTEHKANAVS